MRVQSASENNLPVEKETLSQSLRHCRVSLVPCRKRSRGAAPGLDCGGRALPWRIWKTYLGATPTAILSVKVGSAGLRWRRAWWAFSGGSPTATRFRVCERSGAAGGWRFLSACLSAPCSPGGASVFPREGTKGQMQSVCLEGLGVHLASRA